MGNQHIRVITGANDPEMALIRDVLDSAGIAHEQATCRGRPVYPGNAYRADAPTPADDQRLVAVECAWAGQPRPHVVIDHHRPGDLGYQASPAHFLSGSSIGQVLIALADQNMLPHCLTPPVLDEALRAQHTPLPEHPYIHQVDSGLAPFVLVGPDNIHWLPEAAAFLAAGDHCLAAAYRGECPGIEPDDLLAWRSAVRAYYQGHSAEAVADAVARARRALAEAPCVPDLPGGVRDMRAHTLRELPEAAARDSTPFIARIQDQTGRDKLVLQMADCAILDAWHDWARARNLRETYGGDPVRGFAGGYLP